MIEIFVLLLILVVVALAAGFLLKDGPDMDMMLLAVCVGIVVLVWRAALPTGALVVVAVIAVITLYRGVQE